MKNGKLILFATIIYLISGISCSENSKLPPVPWSVKMAESEMKRSPQAWMLDFSKDLKWNYCHGLVCLAMLETDSHYHTDRFYKYVKQYADTMILENGNIIGYRINDYTLSGINPGRILFPLYNREKAEKYLSALHLLRTQFDTHPRTSEGGLWHKEITTSQIWLDGVYMALPFYAEYAHMCKEPEIFEDILLQLELIRKYHYDETTGLYRHGWDESGQEQWSDTTGKSPCVWGRSLGWFAMGLIDLPDFIPDNHPKREFVLRLYKELMEALLHYQDEKSGVWYQITDKPTEKGNYPESSASCMFTFALLKGLRMGYLEESFFIPSQKAYQGILDLFITQNKDHTVNIIQCCEVGGLGGKPYRDGSYEYYINIPQRDNDPKAVGSFIRASLEWEKLMEMKTNEHTEK